MKKHITLLGAFYIGLGIMGILFCALIVVLFDFIEGMARAAHIGDLAEAILSITLLLIGVQSIVSIIAGFGLLNKQSWARVFGLVAAFLNIFCIPFGTALAIYAIWVLWQDETIELLS